MRRCGVQVRRQLGCVLAFGGLLIVFLCMPVEFFLLIIGMGMTAAGLALINLS